MQPTFGGGALTHNIIDALIKRLPQTTPNPNDCITAGDIDVVMHRGSGMQGVLAHLERMYPEVDQRTIAHILLAWRIYERVDDDEQLYAYEVGQALGKLSSPAREVAYLLYHQLQGR